MSEGLHIEADHTTVALPGYVKMQHSDQLCIPLLLFFEIRRSLLLLLLVARILPAWERVILEPFIVHLCVLCLPSPGSLNEV